MSVSDDNTKCQELAEWLGRRPGREADAEAVWWEAVDTGIPHVLCALAEWLATKAGREADAEAAFRKAVVSGDSRALEALVKWLGGQPGREAEANQIVLFGLDGRGRTANY